MLNVLQTPVLFPLLLPLSKDVYHSFEYIWQLLQYPPPPKFFMKKKLNNYPEMAQLAQIKKNGPVLKITLSH